LPPTILAGQQFLFQISSSLKATGFGRPINRACTEPKTVVFSKPVAGVNKGVFDAEIRQGAVHGLRATVMRDP